MGKIIPYHTILNDQGIIIDKRNKIIQQNTSVSIRNIKKLFFISPFLEIQDVPTFYRTIRKTKVLNDVYNQSVYKFYPQSILIFEEYLLKW